MPPNANEFLDECTIILDQREFSPPDEYWLRGDENVDEAEGYCFDCVRIRLYEEMHHADGYVSSGGYYDESDGPRTCDRCGRLLGYVLTNDGVDDELDHFENDGHWDWDDPTDCFELARIAHAVYTDEQKRRFASVLRRGAHCPDVLAAAGIEEPR